MEKRPARRDPAGLDQDAADAALGRLRASLGAVLKGVRAKLGMSQADFAASLDVNQTTIAHQETGDHLMRVGTWLKVGHLAGVPFYELFQRACERDVQPLRGGMRNNVVLVTDEELALVDICRHISKEGLKRLMEQASAYPKVFPLEDNVVPLLPVSNRAAKVKKRPK